MTWNDDIPDTPEYLGGGGSDEERWPADGLDRLIAESAREYNAPPPTVPRDAMWEAIMAARPQAAAPQAPVAAPVAAVATPVISLADRRADRSARNRGLLAVAAAAVIFLATGIGIGRWWGPGNQAAGANGGPSQVAATTPTPAPATATRDTASPTETGTPASTEVAPDAPRSTQLAGSSTRRAAGQADRGAAPGTRVDAYDVAVLRHFAQAEALLVSYRADTVDAATDSRLAAWARPLLGDTRLLLDSPAASDPRRRRLLEDLELVLAELARLAPPPAGTVATTDSSARSQRTERQLIDGTLRRGQLLPRLRTLVVPAGT